MLQLSVALLFSLLFSCLVLLCEIFMRALLYSKGGLSTLRVAVTSDRNSFRKVAGDTVHAEIHLTVRISRMYIRLKLILLFRKEVRPTSPCDLIPDRKYPPLITAGSPAATRLLADSKGSRASMHGWSLLHQ